MKTLVNWRRRRRRCAAVASISMAALAL